MLSRPFLDKPCAKTGFVAGTLIWTDKGLVPIEQIRVGDRVLSKPETNDGPQAYQRVLKTFHFDDQEVEFVEVARGHRGMGPGFGCTAIVVTGDHPVWAKKGSESEWRWQPVLPVGSTSQVELQDGGVCDVIVNEAVLLCETPEGARIEGIGYVPVASDSGASIDFRSGTPVCQLSDSGTTTSGDYSRDRYLTRVYNFTVEDSHTYYVGEWGFWVHNANGLELGATIKNARGSIPAICFGGWRLRRRSATIGHSGPPIAKRGG
ncbi:MAG TPA: Hint domain-containing protein [Accumulibacter sp.]|nr:Hint domain-containing protein [Accumulibacter sp.]HMW18296.1 Hint domain-containing protein [Accumulibacter sp.]HMX22632.1 Hint domain-containing protein [Accumulibacter sp.]HMY06507.1 Hint domain-containing protein [Accumulibacter sp.]HNC18042.1 Hint domain-containing protein [Accumulibacter sp.]